MSYTTAFTELVPTLNALHLCDVQVNPSGHIILFDDNNNAIEFSQSVTGCAVASVNIGHVDLQQINEVWINKLLHCIGSFVKNSTSIVCYRTSTQQLCLQRWCRWGDAGQLMEEVHIFLGETLLWRTWFSTMNN